MQPPSFNRRVPDASQFSGFLYAAFSFRFGADYLFHYYAVRVIAFQQLYRVPLNRAINQEVKIACQKWGQNPIHGVPGTLFPYSAHRMESEILRRLKKARRFYNRWEGLIRRWHRRFG